MKKRFSFWDVLAWVALGMIIIWGLLKSMGIINTPLWLQYAPIWPAIYIAGWQIHKLEIVAQDVKELKKFKYKTIEEINNLKLNCIKKH